MISLDYILTGFKGDVSFAVIAFPYIALAIFTGWFTRIYGLRWREAITFNYIPRWRNVDKEIEGASQRIQEDCNRWARIVESLVLHIVRAIMTLIDLINIAEIRNKELQRVNCIFLSPIFITKKSNKFLGIQKFNILSNYTKAKVICLGGIKKNNLNKIKLLNSYGFSSVSLFKENIKYIRF